MTFEPTTEKSMFNETTQRSTYQLSQESQLLNITLLLITIDYWEVHNYQRPFPHQQWEDCCTETMND